MLTRFFYIIVGVLFLSTQLHSQEAAPVGGINDIYIKSPTMEKLNDSLYITMKIEASNLHIHSNQAVKLNIYVRNSEKQVALAPVLFSGKLREAYDKRNRLLTFNAAPVSDYIFTGINKKEKYDLDYAFSIPYASWMDDAELLIQQFFNDCCGYELLAEQDYSIEKVENNDIKAVLEKATDLFCIEPHNPDWTPNLSLIAQMVEFLPAQDNKPTGELTFRLHYPNNISDILPTYGDNKEAIRKLDSLFSRKHPGDECDWDQISVTSYASPEGMYYRNDSLARKRLIKFQNYFTNKYKWNDLLLKKQWVAENWDGLTDLLNKSDVWYKQQVLDIIYQIDISKGREGALLRLHSGLPYKEMMTAMFPLLRYTEIRITYKSASAKKEIRYTHLDELSLDELLDVTQQYPPNSSERENIYGFAVEKYSDNSIVNNNMAAIYLANGDLQKAGKYLAKIKNDPISYVNLGVYHYLRGEFIMARGYFSYAAEQNNRKAIENLQLLKTESNNVKTSDNT